MTSNGTITRKPRSQPSKPAFSKLAHGYQKRAVQFLLKHGAAALLLDPGMGKTAITLKAFDALRRSKVGSKMLVIAPLRPAQLVWPEEPNEWSDLAHLRVVLLHGPKKEKLLQEDADVYVINPEGLEWLVNGGRGKTFNAKRWRELGFDTLVIDELTKFKHAKGSRFKILKQVLGTFQRRWGLTGTPAPNGLLDLFGQMYVLDLGNALGKYITHYRMKFFVQLDPNGWKWGLQPGAADRIYDAIRPLAMRADAEDYLELPEIVPLKVWSELPPKVRELYDTLEEDLLAKMDDQVITAANAAAISTKLRQVANGALYVSDDVASKVQGKKREVLELHDGKLDAVENLLDELSGEQLLLAYDFNHDLARLRERFPDAPYIGAGVKLAEAKAIEAAWNAGEIPLLLGHPGSMGHGLNLQKSSATHVGWFGMIWDLELYDQFIKRVRRQGSKAKRVFVHHFMVKDTIDETVYHVQRSKERGQNALLTALKGRRR